MEQITDHRRVLVLTGPTASGKTAVSVFAAELLGGEIISADSRQVYRGIDIGTAKPTPSEQRGIPHYCIDVADLSEPYTAGTFARDARALVKDMFQRGVQPVVVGGSGLYIQALTEGIFDGPAADPALRKELEMRHAQNGIEGIWEELVRLDPESAEYVPKTNIPRVIRALEVCLLSGEPYTKIRRERMVVPEFDSVMYGLDWNRSVLYARINNRVLAMIEAGLIDEVRRLQAQGASPEWQSLNTVGYKEVFAHLNGELTRDETIDQIQQHTRNYAKRQLTWFRNKTDVHWIDPGGLFDPRNVARNIVDNFKDAAG